MLLLYKFSILCVICIFQNKKGNQTSDPFSLFFLFLLFFRKKYVLFIFLKTVFDNKFRKHIEHCYCYLNLVFYVFLKTRRIMFLLFENTENIILVLLKNFYRYLNLIFNVFFTTKKLRINSVIHIFHN